MTCLKEHSEHLLPQVNCRYLLSEDLTSTCKGLIILITFFEQSSVKSVKISDLIGAKKHPVLPCFHALHKEIWNPICCVHIMGTPPLITCVDTQLEEVKYVAVPCFQISTARPFAFPPLVNGHQLVVV